MPLKLHCAIEFVVVALVVAMATIASAMTNVTDQDGVYKMAGPGGLVASLSSDTGVLTVGRTLKQTTEAQTTVAPAVIQNTTNQVETETRPPSPPPPPPQSPQQTDVVAIQATSLQCVNTSGGDEVLGKTIEFRGICRFKVKETIDQSDCATFVCASNGSKVEEEVCFVSLDDPSKSVVKVTFMVSEWSWCPLYDHLPCETARIQATFRVSIHKDLSIARAADAMQTANFTTFTLGHDKAFVQFGNLYREYNEDHHSKTGNSSISLVLTETFAGSVRASFSHGLESPTSSLEYEVVLDPGYKSKFKAVIAGSQNKVVTPAALILAFVVCVSLE